MFFELLQFLYWKLFRLLWYIIDAIINEKVLIIDEIEKVKRKFYAGAIGYFAGDQMDSCIALRTAMIKDGKIYLQAGGGVVADSDPESEYQETINKAKALMRAAEDAVNYV